MSGMPIDALSAAPDRYAADAPARWASNADRPLNTPGTVSAPGSARNARSRRAGCSVSWGVSHTMSVRSHRRDELVDRSGGIERPHEVGHTPRPRVAPPSGHVRTVLRRHLVVGHGVLRVPAGVADLAHG